MNSPHEAKATGERPDSNESGFFFAIIFLRKRRRAAEAPSGRLEMYVHWTVRFPKVLSAVLIFQLVQDTEKEIFRPKRHFLT